MREGYGVGVWKTIKNEWKGIKSQVFPNLFSIASNRDGWVAEEWDQVGKEGGWSHHFSRQFND